MYKITKKPKTPNVIWNPSCGSEWARFEKGILSTEDVALAKYLAKAGHCVEEIKTEGIESPDDLAALDAEGLKAYAAARGIDIGNATSQSGILKKIRDAQNGGS